MFPWSNLRCSFFWASCKIVVGPRGLIRFRSDFYYYFIDGDVFFLQEAQKVWLAIFVMLVAMVIILRSINSIEMIKWWYSNIFPFLYWFWVFFFSIHNSSWNSLMLPGIALMLLFFLMTASFLWSGCNIIYSAIILLTGFFLVPSFFATMNNAVIKHPFTYVLTSTFISIE